MTVAIDSAASQARFARLTGSASAQLWHLSPAERLRRQLARGGIEVVDRTSTSGAQEPVLVLRSDAVLDDVVIQALSRAPRTILILPEGVPLAVCCEAADAANVAETLTGDGVALPEAYTRKTAVQLAGSHNKQLRKRQDAYAAQVNPQTAAIIERQLFDASYKGVTDAVTKFLWPEIAFRAVKLCTRFGISPNQVTFVSLLFTLAAMVLFVQAWFLTGLACAWIMALLDTVDGKLARVTATSSKWGNVFDHGIDLIAPPLWWIAWWIGLGGMAPGGTVAILVAVIAGHLGGKLVEQAFISTFGLKIHVWRRFDSTFRLFTARRNPNVVILTLATLLAGPSVAYVAMMIWIYLSLAVHIARYFYALYVRSQGQVVGSWLEQNA